MLFQKNGPWTFFKGSFPVFT